MTAELPGYAAVDLATLRYKFTRSATPLQQLRRFVARQLGLKKVPGRFLLTVEWTVLQTPVDERRLLLNERDWRVLARLTRAFALSACKGSTAMEAYLWSLPRNGPFVYRGVPAGFAWYRR